MLDSVKPQNGSLGSYGVQGYMRGKTERAMRLFRSGVVQMHCFCREKNQQDSTKPKHQQAAELRKRLRRWMSGRHY